jgi:hypothetical protein
MKMPIWYRFTISMTRPKPVEVVKVSKEFVTIRLSDRDQRRAITSSGEVYRPSVEECWGWRIGISVQELDAARRAVAFKALKVDELVRARDADIGGKKP